MTLIRATLDGRALLALRVSLRRGGRASTCEAVLPPGETPRPGDALRLVTADAKTRREFSQFRCVRVTRLGDGRARVHGADARADWPLRPARADTSLGDNTRDVAARLFVSAGLDDPPDLPALPVPVMRLRGSLAACLERLLTACGLSLTVDDGGAFVAAPLDATAEIDPSRLMELAESRDAPREIIVIGGPPLRLVEIAQGWRPVLPDERGEAEPLADALARAGVSDDEARRACLVEDGFRNLLRRATSSEPGLAERLTRYAFRVFEAPDGEPWLPVGGVNDDGVLLPPALRVETDLPRHAAPGHPAADAFEAASDFRAPFELDLSRRLVLLSAPPYQLAPRNAEDPTFAGRALQGGPRFALIIAVAADLPPFQASFPGPGDGNDPPAILPAPELRAVYGADGKLLNQAALQDHAGRVAGGRAALALRDATLAGVGDELALGGVHEIVIEAGADGLLTRLRSRADRPAVVFADPGGESADHVVKPDPSGHHQPRNAFRDGPLVLRAEGETPEGETVMAARAVDRDRAGILELRDFGPLSFPYYLASTDAAKFGRWFFVAGVEARPDGRLRVLGDGRHAPLPAGDFADVRLARPVGLRGLLIAVEDELRFVDAGPLVSDTRGRLARRASNLVADLDGSTLSEHKRGGLHYLTAIAYSPVHAAWVPALNLRDSRTGPHDVSGRGLFAERDGRALGRLAAFGNGGPVMADAPSCEKHFYGAEARDDGLYRECAGHLSTEAFFKIPGDAEHDAPLTFYPEPFEGEVPPWPPFEARILYDINATHVWDDKARRGRWRIQYRVPFLPEDPPVWEPLPEGGHSVVTPHEVRAPGTAWIPVPSEPAGRGVTFPGPSLRGVGFGVESGGAPLPGGPGGCVFLPPGRSLANAHEDSGERDTVMLLHPEVSLAFGAPDFETGRTRDSWVFTAAPDGLLHLRALAGDGGAAGGVARGLRVMGHVAAGPAGTTFGEDAALLLGQGLERGMMFGDDLRLYHKGEATLKVDGSFEVDGKLTVSGIIDPTGLELTPQAVNPGGASTIWVDLGGNLRFGSAVVDLSS